MVAAPSRLRYERGITAIFQYDDGSGCKSVALDHWCYWKMVRSEFSPPGKPTNNAAIECFHNRLRLESFALTDAQQTNAQYQSKYNHNRPHSSLGNVPSAHFRAAVAITASVSSTGLGDSGGTNLWGETKSTVG